MKILLIDDSNFSLTMMRNWLAELLPGMEILSTNDASEAMKIFDRESPEIVITDLLMPEVNGDDVVKYVRSKDKQCFICVASANVQKIVKQELMDLGADLFLEKPFTQEKGNTLVETLKQKLDI